MSSVNSKTSGQVKIKTTTAVIPGDWGLDCVLYNYIYYRTIPQKTEVYITFTAKGGEFRPVAGEHAPKIELSRYQAEAGDAAGIGDKPYGLGESLEVTFTCYSPPGSSAAAEAVQEIEEALDELRGLAGHSDWERSKLGIMYGTRVLRATFRNLAAPYRPPKSGLPRRSGPPKPRIGPAEKPRTSSHPPDRPKPSPSVSREQTPQQFPVQKPTFDDLVRGRLKQWGMLGEYDRMQAERRREASK